MLLVSHKVVLVRKLVYFGLVEVQTVKIIFLANVGRFFDNLKIRKFKFFRDLKSSGVSSFPFWVIEPIRKDRNDIKLKALYLAVKQMNGVLFSWV